MNNFSSMLLFGLKRRSKDFFIIIYNLILPIILICALGYLMSPDYENFISSYQYYTIVLIPFFISLSVSTALYNSKEDKMNNVSGRIILSPLTDTNIVLPKILSSTIILIIITSLLVILCNLIFKMNLGVSILQILLLYTCFIFLITSLGYFIGFACRNEEIIRNYITLPICIFAFMGGSFFPVGSLNSIIDNLLKISPIYWINNATFSLIYNNNPSILYLLSSLSFILGIILTITCIKKFKKEVFI